MAVTIRGTLTDNYGRPIAGASVTVYKAGTLNTGSLYSDAAMTVGVTNPLTTGTDGAYGPVYAPNGKYDLVFAATGYTFTTADSVSEDVYNPWFTRTVTGVTAVDDRDMIIFADASGGAVTLNLQQISTMLVTNRMLVVVKTDSSTNAVTINRGGADTINGATSIALTAQYQQATLLGKTGDWKAVFLIASDQAGPIRPAFSTVLSADQTLTSNVTAKVTFNSEEFDTNNNYDPATNYRFTPTVAGKYLIALSVSVSATDVMNRAEAWLYKNGAAYKEARSGYQDPIAAGGSGSRTLPISVVVDANGTTDYFEVYVWTNCTGTPTVSSSSKGSYFTGMRI